MGRESPVGVAPAATFPLATPLAALAITLALALAITLALAQGLQPLTLNRAERC